jgi:hypothetical protein
MPEHSAPCFLSRASGDLVCDHATNPAIFVFALLTVTHHTLAIPRSRSFRSDDDCGEMTAIGARLNRRNNPFVIERDFRNQDDVRSSGNAPVQGDPARVASHHLEHHDAFVACGSRVQTVERVHHGRYRGVEPEGHGGGFEIVVDGFGDADAINAGILKLLRRRHGAVATHDYEAVDTQ